MLRGYAVPVVRAAEAEAMAGLPDGELMQRAARGLAQVLAAQVARTGTERVVVLAGPGDNGGDALWAAALLTDLVSGVDVTVLAAVPELHPEGLSAAVAAGIPVLEVPPGDELPEAVDEVLGRAQLVVDGLLGIGGRPGLTGAMAALVTTVPDTAYLVAVDLPSGTDPEGRAAGEVHVVADRTVTFGAPKPVHLLPATAGAVGELAVVDIGVTFPEDVDPVVERLEPEDVAELWPVPGPADDKYTRGVLGVVAGGERYPGAAVLTCRAAVEAGAGMVRYIGTPMPTSLVLQSTPEVVPRGERVQAWVVGPGVDSADGSVAGRAQVRAARRALESDLPCLVDAGALDLLLDLVPDGGRAAPTLLTPHAGELARLLSGLARRAGSTGAKDQVSAEQVRADPLGHARRAAELTGCTVLLKGAVTLVVSPDADRPVRSQASGPPWLATAGAGDVLAGVCGVLLAAGLDPFDAGAVGAAVHGLAAQRASAGGPLRALAVAQALPGTVAQLLATS